MIFDMADGNKMYAGMNTEGYDWKKFVLNTFSWLSKIEPKSQAYPLLAIQGFIPILGWLIVNQNR